LLVLLQLPRQLACQEAPEHLVVPGEAPQRIGEGGRLVPSQQVGDPGEGVAGDWLRCGHAHVCVCVSAARWMSGWRERESDFEAETMRETDTSIARDVQRQQEQTVQRHVSVRVEWERDSD